MFINKNNQNGCLLPVAIVLIKCVCNRLLVIIFSTFMTITAIAGGYISGPSITGCVFDPVGLDELFF